MMGDCPHCGTSDSPIADTDTITINLELGSPTAEEALDVLTAHIRSASDLKIRTLVVIHGYGSTGKGGSIKRMVRDSLEKNFFADRVDEYIHGEDLAHRNNLYQDLEIGRAHV